MQQIPDFFQKIAAGLIVTFIAFACARQSAPTGGPKDLDPPKLDSIASTPNYSTRFSPQRIELRFDEWITLDNPATLVVISPPLAKRHKVTLKGKTVYFEFPTDETLRPNTTYTINFGKSIKDLHEGNAATDLRFIFSTGDFIDSLRIDGRVVDAYTNDPVDNVTVMLYDVFTDSIIRQERPYYFARTDASGLFSVENMKPGRYKAVAIEDADQNLKWAGEIERIAFPDSLLTLGDTQKNSLNLRIFGEHKAFRLADKNESRYGQVKLSYTGRPDSVRIKADQPDMPLLTEISQDTLLVWYDLVDSIPWQLIADRDTVLVRVLNRSDFLQKNRILFSDDAAPGAGSGQNRKAQRIQQQTAPAAPGRPLPARTISQSQNKPGEVIFKTPVVRYDTSRWIVTVDSVRQNNFSVVPDSFLRRKLLLNTRWTPGKMYGLELLPGAVTDFFGVSNTDTLRRFYNVPTEKQLGGLSLRLEDLKPGRNYVVQLQNGGAIDSERRFVADSTSTRLKYTSLPTANYTVVLIEDTNNNGRWDSGNYYAHRQPEFVFIKKLEALRPNWEVEATVSTRTTADKKKKQE